MTTVPITPSKLKTISPLTLTNFEREKTKNMTN